MEKLKKGFTLIEVIVVITIIAILAAIIVPTSMYFIEKANISKEVQQMNISNDIQTLFVNSNMVPFDLSCTSDNDEYLFINQIKALKIPYKDLGSIKIDIQGNGDDWIVSFTLIGQEYGNEDNGSILSATLLNTYNNEQILKGSKDIPSNDWTYLYQIDKSNGDISLLE